MTEQTYDADLRRDTPLGRALIARIGATGPITVRDYMEACLNHPQFGYYRTRGAIGSAGDFVTAPEISQIFGELVGLWCAVVWQQMGSPLRFNLIELGAGRGTLLADALRATRQVRGFRDAVTVHIVDHNPILIEMQRDALAGAGATTKWHATLDTLPIDAPSLWIGNEFLDTVPVDQFDRLDGHWVSRAIGLDAARQLAYVPAPPDWIQYSDVDLGVSAGEAAGTGDGEGPAPTAWRDGDTLERQPLDTAILGSLRARALTQPLAALFVDYGYVGGATRDTLQAVRAHRHEHVLTSPGEADLSCHVDFNAFARAAERPSVGNGCLAVDGPTTQAEFLGRLGMMERASRLMAANPTKANALEMGVGRLMAPHGMGTRFKAIGIRSSHLPALPGFAVEATR